MARIILIADKWRLRKIDELNYVLEEFREPSESHLTRSNEPKWMKIGGENAAHYFQHVGPALEWLLHHRMLNDPGECANVEDAVKRMQEIADEIKRIEVVA